MSAPRFDALVAIGDNLCIDTNTVGPHRGAASLLYRNRDAEFPEFKGRDMVTRDPAVRLLMLGQDGATIKTTLSYQTKRLQTVDEPVLVTMSAGSKDLLAHMTGVPDDAVADGDALYDGLTRVFEEVARHLSDAIMFLGNIPEPDHGAEAPPLLAEFNTAIADVAREQGASLIDIHGHFLEHGKSADEPWLTETLDPTIRGAHEIRRLFWQALMDL